MVFNYTDYITLQGTVVENSVVINSLNGLTNKETKKLGIFSYNGSYLLFPTAKRFISEQPTGSDIELLVKVNIKVHHGVYRYNLLVYKARKPKCTYGLKRFSFVINGGFTNERLD